MLVVLGVSGSQQICKFDARTGNGSYTNMQYCQIQERGATVEGNMLMANGTVAEEYNKEDNLPLTYLPNKTLSALPV